MQNEVSLDEIYMNLPTLARNEHTEMADRRKTDAYENVVKITSDAEPKKQKKEKERICKSVVIECQRLNKNKVLEKIKVEVSQEVFEALKLMNPELSIKNSHTKPWKVLKFNSEDFCLGKSLQEVKTALHWLKNLKNGRRYECSKPEITSL